MPVIGRAFATAIIKGSPSPNAAKLIDKIKIIPVDYGCIEKEAARQEG